jgi:glycosyltransferase involved in cell wall biosynthesis
LSPQHPRLSVSIAVPYPEGAIVEYARWAEQNDKLVGLWLPARDLTRWIARLLPSARSGLMRSRISRGVEDIKRVHFVAPALEVLRLVSRDPKLRSIAPNAMDHYKRLFDRAASRQIKPANALVGMPGASERMFARVDPQVRVLHAVDGHPRAVNRLLRSTFGAVAEREIVPEKRVEQIERELAAADVVIVPSALKRRQYAEFGVEERKMVIAPYGVKLERFFPDASAGDDRLRPRLLFVGQISYRKGVPLLIDAVRDLDVDVLLVGPVVEPAILNGLPKNVTHQGAVAPAALNEHMNKCDALILPSLEDAFGLVVLEALAAGLPVLTTDETGAAEVVGENDGRVLRAGDAQQLRTAISEVSVLDDSDRRERAERMRAAGDRWTWDRFAGLVDDAISAAHSVKASRR